MSIGPLILVSANAAKCPLDPKLGTAIGLVTEEEVTVSREGADGSVMIALVTQRGGVLRWASEASREEDSDEHSPAIRRAYLGQVHLI